MIFRPLRLTAQGPIPPEQCRDRARRRMTMKTVAEQWEVEWTTDVPIVDGDAEVDAGTVNTRAFKTKAAALRFAKTVIEQDFWGCPCVSLMRLQIVNCNDGGPPMRDWFCVETVEVE